MAVESIEQTVNNALPGGARQYAQYVRPVVTALADREAQIKRELADYATQQGLSQRDAEAVFTRVGLSGGAAGNAGGTEAGELQAIRRGIEDLNTRLDGLARRGR